MLTLVCFVDCFLNGYHLIEAGTHILKTVVIRVSKYSAVLGIDSMHYLTLVIQLQVIFIVVSLSNLGLNGLAHGHQKLFLM